MNANEEKRLRNLFQQLGGQDEQRAPSFINIWSGALSRQRKAKRPPVPVWRFAAAVAILIIAGLLVFKSQKNQMQTAGVSVTIERWRSPTASLLNFPIPVAPFALEKGPTDVLLRLPGQEFLQSAPSVGELKWLF